MRAHSWPGNVRELAHSVERAVLMADPSATAIAARHLSLRQRVPGDAPPVEDLSLEEAERVFIEKVLSKHQGDVRLAAEQLGMWRFQAAPARSLRRRALPIAPTRCGSARR